MKKAVIAVGGRQYLVTENQEIEVNLLKDAKKTVDFDALLVINDKDISVGTPAVKDIKVSAQVLEAEVLGDKVTAIRFKAKKRVSKVHGHRQRLTRLKITKIA